MILQQRNAKTTVNLRAEHLNKFASLVFESYERRPSIHIIGIAVPDRLVRANTNLAVSDSMIHQYIGHNGVFIDLDTT